MVVLSKREVHHKDTVISITNYYLINKCCIRFYRKVTQLGYKS